MDDLHLYVLVCRWKFVPPVHSAVRIDIFSQILIVAPINQSYWTSNSKTNWPPNMTRVRRTAQSWGKTQKLVGNDLDPREKILLSEYFSSSLLLFDQQLKTFVQWRFWSLDLQLLWNLSQTRRKHSTTAEPLNAAYNQKCLINLETSLYFSSHSGQMSNIKLLIIFNVDLNKLEPWCYGGVKIH